MILAPDPHLSFKFRTRTLKNDTRLRGCGFLFASLLYVAHPFTALKPTIFAGNGIAEIVRYYSDSKSERALDLLLSVQDPNDKVEGLSNFFIFIAIF